MMYLVELGLANEDMRVGWCVHLQIHFGFRVSLVPGAFYPESPAMIDLGMNSPKCPFEAGKQ